MLLLLLFLSFFSFLLFNLNFHFNYEFTSVLIKEMGYAVTYEYKPAPDFSFSLGVRWLIHKLFGYTSGFQEPPWLQEGVGIFSG